MEDNNKLETGKSSSEIAVTEDLKPILAVLKPEDAKQLLVLREELTDNWNKKQIFRTETEMRISVLNDAKHPTPASKYWQSVREMSGHFDAMMGLSFEMRHNEVKRLRLEKRLVEAKLRGDVLDIMEIEIDIDQNIYNKMCMEQQAHDRVRELTTWSKIKAELNDGSFDDQEVNTHQAETLQMVLTTRAQSLGPNSDPAEIINAIGPLSTLNRLKTEDNKLLTFAETRKQIESK